MVPNIIFFKVTTNTQKLAKLTEIALEHFRSKQPLLIHVDTVAAAKFIDTLLWQMPQESFLPHSVDCRDLITITTLAKNHNEATLLFNLTSKGSPLTSTCQLVYDFMDMTSQEKSLLSQERLDTYQKMSYSCLLQ